MQHCMWTPGENLAVITRNGVIVIEQGFGALSREFWTMLEEGVDLGTLLQTLTSACGTNLAALPNFVALVPEAGGVHVAVRGAFELAMDTEAGPVAMTSGNVITWEEKRVEGLSGWKISSPITSQDEDAAETEELIAASAIIPISTLSFGTMTASYPAGRHAQEAPEAVSPEAEETPTAPLPPSSSADVSAPAAGTQAKDNATPAVVPDATAEEHGNSADDHLGYTLTEEQIHLTRAYTDDEDLAALTAEDDGEPAPQVATPSPVLPEVPTPADPGQPAPAAHPAVPGQDFSDLFSEHTRRISIEDAAVRHVRNDDNPFADLPAPTPADAVVPAADEGAQPTPDAPTPAILPGQEAPASAPGYIPPPITAPAQATTEPPKTPSGFFIDSVPGSSGTPPTPPSAPILPGQEPPHAPMAGIHDGHTVRSDKMAYLREQAQNMVTAAAPAEPATDAPMVVALLCVAGHPNPTHVQSCRVCEGAMTEHSTTVARPSLGSLHFSTGEVVSLDRDVVIGRRPRYTPQPGRPEAHIVPVPSPNQEISRTHCEIRIDGWEARVRDLGSNNGTFLLRHGQSPMRVTDSTPVLLRPGDILDLGDAVSVRMEA